MYEEDEELLTEETTEESAQEEEMDFEALFADEEDEEAEETTDAQTDEAETDGEEKQDGEQGSEQKPAADNAPATIPVKYNGQEMKVPLEQAAPLIQMGMNYKAMQQKLTQQAENAPEKQLVARMAAAAGKTPEEYLQAAETMLQQRQIQQLVQSGVPQQAAARLVQLEYAEKQNAAAQMAAQQTAQQAQREKAQQEQNIKDLLEVYPDIKEIPAEALALVQQGHTPLNAMLMYENTQMKKQTATKEKAAQNAATTPGSVKGQGAAKETKMNAFLEGLLGG